MTLPRADIDGHLLKHAAGHCGEKPCITVLALEELLEARELLRMIQRGEWDDTAIDTYLKETV